MTADRPAEITLLPSAKTKAVLRTRTGYAALHGLPDNEKRKEGKADQYDVYHWIADPS